MNLEKLANHIKNSLEQVNLPNLEAVLNKFKASHYKKGQAILKLGEISKEILFVCEGNLQVRYYDEQGELWTRDFISPEQWCCSLDSFLNACPAQEEIFALRPSFVLAISKADFNTLLETIPQFATMYQKIMTELNIEIQNRIRFVLTKSAKERIEWLYTNKPEYFSQFSSKNLASYLHLNKDVFSRLKSPVLKELGQQHKR